jgi:hypothetical protein
MCSARTEMYVRAILYNMSMLLRRLLGQSRFESIFEILDVLFEGAATRDLERAISELLATAATPATLLLHQYMEFRPEDAVGI